VIVAAALVLAAASSARAQTSIARNGMVTGQIGGIQGGDVRGRGVTPSMSLAILEINGLGAELDIGHARSFDSERFAESGVTTVAVNVIGMWPHPMYKPYALGGVGVMRVRASVFEGVEVASRTDLAFDAGGGFLVLFNDTVGVRADLRYFRYFQRFSDVPLLDNGFFDYWRTSVGVTLSWGIR
jgi:hypothetical protein